MQLGLGKHIVVVAAADPTAPIPFLKELLAGELVYTLSITFTKYSILAFYRRIFRVSRTIRIPIFVLTGIVSAWSVAVVSRSWLVSVEQKLTGLGHGWLFVVYTDCCTLDSDDPRKVH